MVQACEGSPIKCGKSTIAEGIAVTEPGRITLPIVKKFVDEIILIGEDEIEAALLLILEVEKTVVEGAGAIGLAALLKNPRRFSGRRVGLILSGGNIDLMVLSSIIHRGLARSGRLVRIIVEIPDIPGALADVTRLLGDENANIVEVRHQRAFKNLSLRSAEVEFVLHTRGNDHVRKVVDSLNSKKYKAFLIDNNRL